MKKNYFKKSLSLIMTVLMLMSCWVFVAPIDAEAAALETASALYNKTQLNGINTNIDTTMPTTMGKFKSDGMNGDENSSWHVSQYGSKHYKNIFYSPTVDINGYAIFWGSDVISGIDSVRVYYPETVMIYDGSTKPQMGVVACLDGASRAKVRAVSLYLDSNANGLVITDHWKGYTTGDLSHICNIENGSYQFANTYEEHSTYKTNTKKNGEWYFYASDLRFDGTLSSDEFVRTVKPTWGFYGGKASTANRYTQTASKNIYVMNVKAYRDLLTTINTDKTNISNNAGQYTPESVKAYVNAANAILNLNPKNVSRSGSAVATWGSNMSTAYTSYVNAKNGLKNREYEVTYDNMFSLADWKYSASSEKANVTTDLNAGKVTVVYPSNAGGDEYVTPHSGNSTNANTRNTSNYAMPVVGGQEYTMKYTTDGEYTEMFAFFYDANGGCTHAGSSYGAYNFSVAKGTGQRTITAPTGSVYMEIRFDNNTPSSTANFWDIMIYPAAVKTENEVDNWTSRPHRQLYNYGATVGTLQTPARPGYIFDGWKEDTDGDGIGDAAISGTVTKSRVVYSTWKPGTMDVGYDNLFSLSMWANSNSSVASNTARGSIAYDLDAGTITAITTKDGEVYSNYGSAAGHYQMTVKPNTEYIFTADVDLEGSGNQGQMFVFFYDASGAGATGAIYNGANQSNPHIGLYVSNEGRNSLTFTTPANCTKISIRVGATVVPTTAVYSNIGVYKKADYDAYAKNYEKVREPFIIGDTDNLMRPTREGYVFDGWTLADGTNITSVSGLTASTVVYANWTKEYTVTYYYGDNTTVLATEKVKEGSTVGSLPTVTPTKDTTAEYKYEFDHWYADSKEFKADTVITSDISVYPVFNNIAHDFVWASYTAQDATCTSAAVVNRYCKDCYYDLGDITYTGDKTEWLALGHEYTGGILNNSDQKDGTHLIKCVRYNDCKSTDKDAHKWSGSLSEGATCVLPGKIKQICPCGAQQTIDGELDDTNHVNTKLINVVAPDCENDGYTGDTYCDDCNTIIEYGEDDPKLGHSFTNYTSDGNATCTADGTKTAVCDRDGCNATDTITDAGSKIAHKYTNYVYNNDAKCGVDGTKTAECDTCDTGATKTITAEGTAREHEYTGTIKDNENGTHSYKCKYDDCDVYGGTVDCTYGEWDTTDSYYHVATCTACGYELKGEHNWTPWATTDEYKQADGQHARSCYVCHKEVVKNCTYTRISYTETCTKDGYTRNSCNDCGHNYKTNIIGKKGHDYTGAAKSYNNGQHSFLCKNGCNTYGYAGVENARTTCTYNYANTEAGTHKATCTACAYSFTEDCSGGQASCTTLKVCDKCNTEYGVKDPHSFTGTVVELDGDKHAYLCAYCSTEGLYGVGADEGATEDCFGGEATCTEYAVCTKCDDTYGSLKDHTFDGDVVALDGDVHAYRCSVCKNDELYGVGSVENAEAACSGGTATCTALAVCTVCNDTHGELDADAHKWSTPVADKASEGHTHTYTCEYNAAHTKSEDCYPTMAGVVSPTCNEKGYTVQICQDCADTWNIDYVDALGHDWSDWVSDDKGKHSRTCKRNCEYEDNFEEVACSKDNAKAVVTEPTCTEGGFTTYTCKDCGYVWVDDYTDATGHSYAKQTKKADAAYLRTTKDCVTDWTYWYCCDNCDVSAETEKDKYANEADLYWVREAAAGHKYNADTATADYLATAATCTEQATYYYSCSVCGTSSKGTTEAKTFARGAVLGHDWADTEKYLKSEADCVNNEVYYKECSRCHISSENETGATWEKAETLTGHNFASGYTKAVDATCTKEGVVGHYTCETCGKHFDADMTTEIAESKLVINELGHKWADIAEKEATCEENGYTAHKQCQREDCGYRNIDYKVIPAKGHEFKAENGYYSDTVYNYHAYKCSNCDAYGVNGVKYNADYTGMDLVVVGGIKCEFSGEYVNYEANGAHSHKLTCVCGNVSSNICADADPQYVDPTCTENGYYVNVCDVCNFEWTVEGTEEADKALGHDLAVKSNGNGTHSARCQREDCDYAQAADKCSTDTPATICGTYDICDICDAEFGEAKPHVFGEYVSDGNATCTEDGTKTATCTTCTGETIAKDTVTDKGSALGHAMSEYDYSVEGWADMPEDFDATIIKEATCHEEGVQISFCSRCEHYTTKVVKSNPELHVWEKDENGELVWTTLGGDCASGVTMVNKCTAEGCRETQIKTEKVPHTWKVIYVEEAGCVTDGYIDFVCEVCDFTGTLEAGETVFEGKDYSEDYNIVRVGSHDWEKHESVKGDYAAVDGEIVYVDAEGNIAYVEKFPEYNADGYAYMYCQKCTGKEKVTLEALGKEVYDEEGNLVHKHAEYAVINEDGTITYKSTLKTNAYVAPTCTVGGHKAYEECMRCSFSEYMVNREAFYLEPLGHEDANNNGKCDTCNATVKNDASDSCGCACHKESGIMKFIYKILSFFWKLFKINKTCGCGYTHY